MELKQCPKCGQPMNFQANKTNPKAPDWKCSDANCKWQFRNGQWIASDYITGAWNEKQAETSQPQNIPQNVPEPQSQPQNTPNQATGTDLTYTTPKQRNYDKENFGKCKHAFLVELMKKYYNEEDPEALAMFEKNAEKWAKMSMRKLGEPEVKNGLSDQLPF